MPLTPQDSASASATGRYKWPGSVRTAADVLETFNDGQPDPWNRVMARYPALSIQSPPGETPAAAPLNEETLLTWAADVVAGDPARRTMAARVFQALAAIAFDKDGKAVDRLRALKLLGQECGMFAGGPEFGRKLVIDEIQRIIVDARRADPENVGSPNRDG